LKEGPDDLTLKWTPDSTSGNTDVSAKIEVTTNVEEIEHVWMEDKAIHVILKYYGSWRIIGNLKVHQF